MSVEHAQADSGDLVDIEDLLGGERREKADGAEKIKAKKKIRKR